MTTLSRLLQDRQKMLDSCDQFIAKHKHVCVKPVGTVIVPSLALAIGYEGGYTKGFDDALAYMLKNKDFFKLMLEDETPAKDTAQQYLLAQR